MWDVVGRIVDLRRPKVVLVNTKFVYLAILLVFAR